MAATANDPDPVGISSSAAIWVGLIGTSTAVVVTLPFVPSVAVTVSVTFCWVGSTWERTRWAAVGV